MMRKPSEYIAAAVRGVRDRLMDDCRMCLTHGGDSAAVTRVVSTRRGEDEVVGGGSLGESVRVLALASDFNGISKGDSADLDGSFRIVTSVRKDPSLAAVYIGLSEAFDRQSAAYRGERKNGVVIAGTVPCAFIREPAQDEFEGVCGAAAGIETLSVYVRRADFMQFGGEEPKTGDSITFRNGSVYRVASVDENSSSDEFFSLRVRKC